MAIGNVITVVGNVTRDPELRYTPNGMSVCTFSIAWNRRYDRGGEQQEKVSYFDVDVWREQAENVASSVSKGMRVIVTGYMEQDSWEDNQTGQKRSKFKLVADEVAPSLRWASAEVSRNERSGGFGGGAPQGGGAPMGGGAPQQQQPSQPSYPDEEPF